MSTRIACRRKFMATLGLGGAAAATAVIGQLTTPVKQVAPVRTKAQGSGYQVTEHVRKYYRTTQV